MTWPCPSGGTATSLSGAQRTRSSARHSRAGTEHAQGLAGAGTGLFLVPVASVVMGSVPAHSQGIASGADDGIRELGGCARHPRPQP